MLLWSIDEMADRIAVNALQIYHKLCVNVQVFKSRVSAGYLRFVINVSILQQLDMCRVQYYVRRINYSRMRREDGRILAF